MAIKGFCVVKADDGHVEPFEYLAAGAITPTIGKALTLSSGLLAVASGTTAPAYLAACEGSAALTSGTVIPVTRVSKEAIYETSLSVAGTSLKVGDKVTIASAGDQVTATTTSGTAEIVCFPDGDKTSGARVWVRF